MKISVWSLLLLLPVLSSAGPLDIGANRGLTNVSSIESDVRSNPEAPPNGSMPADRPGVAVALVWLKKQLTSSSTQPGSGSTLEWVTWNNSEQTVPTDAVSISNSYCDRTDYVCKHKCEAGFYTPSKGPYCRYANGDRVSSGSSFQLLVNKDHFEILEWKRHWYGSVPVNSFRTCPKGNIYVGQNKYGLGKVDTAKKYFYLPYEESVYAYWHGWYQVLTTDDDIISQEVSDVRYIIDKAKTFQYPPETVRKTSLRNNECRSAEQTETFTKTYQVERRWDLSASIQVGVKNTITASLPFVIGGSIEFSAQVSFQYSWGGTVTETRSSTVSVQINASANSLCTVHMVEYKNKADIPFIAKLKRIYANGETRITSITGTFNSVQGGEIQAVADRCKPLDKSEPCP